MNWTALWMQWFHTTEWLGLDIGFWVSMASVTLLVVLMNVVFWAMKPHSRKNRAPVDDNLLL